MAKYEATINGQPFSFEAANDAAAGRLVDAETTRRQSGQGTTRKPDEPAAVPPKKDSVEEFTSKVFGSDPAARAGAIAEQQGKQASVAQTAGLGLQQGTLRNWGDELGAMGAASGLPVGTPPILSAPIGAARRLFGDQKAEETYQETLARLRGFYKGASEANPVTSTVAEIGGGFAGPGGPGGSLARRAIGGAAVGAADAALAGAGAGTDASSRLEGAGVGAAVGGAGGGLVPLATNAVSKLARPFLGNRQVEAEAAQRVGGALQKDVGALSPADQAARATELRTAYERGQPVVVGDVGGKAVESEARAAANLSPEAEATIRGTTEPRFQSQAERATSWWDDLTGSPNALETRTTLRNQATAENKPNYEKAYAAGKDIWDGELQTLSASPTVQSAIKDASKSSADYAAREGFPAAKNPFVQNADGTLTLPEGVKPDLQFWDHVQRNLREAAERAPQGGEEARRINGLRDALNDKLDARVPEFKDARDVARGFFGKGDALEAGQGFLDRPVRGGHAEEQAAFARMTPAEKELFAQGVTESVRNRFAAVPDNQEISRQFNTPEMRNRLNMALGPDRAADLHQYLKVEKTMSQLKNALGNSTTAKQLVGLASYGTAGAAGGGLADYAGLDVPGGGMTMGGLLTLGLKHSNNKMNTAVANRVAQMLTSQDTTVLRNGVRIIARNKVLRDAFDKLGTRVSAVAGQQTGAAEAGGPQ